MTRSELILYATPQLELGEQCERYFDQLRRTGRATTAQTYPPHVTITGFLRREPQVIERVIREVEQVVAAEPEGMVVVEELRETDEWLGLVVSSDWLADLGRAFADRHGLETGDDAVRLKEWLHLSLAYGDLPFGLEMAELGDVARSTVSVDAPVCWSIGLWHRRGAEWARLC